MDYVGKIIYYNEEVKFIGTVPIKLEFDRKTEKAELEFCIKNTISMSERLSRKNRQKENPLVQITRKEHDGLL